MAEEGEHTLTQEEQDEIERKRKVDFKAEVVQSLIMVRKVIEKYDQEIDELKRRRAARKEEQAKWLERIVRHEEERRKRHQEEMARIKEEQERKRKEREERKRAMRNPIAYQNVVEDERIRFARMTREELAREKEETLAKRVPALDPEAMTSDESLKAIARELHAKIVKAFGALFDLQEKEKRQKYDINELTTRIAALQKQKIQASAFGKVSMPGEN